MKVRNTILMILPAIMFMLSGCIVRSYEATRDRLDQDLTVGNRGYMSGEAPMPQERKTTRAHKVVEVEMHPLIKFERMPESGKAQKTAIPEPLLREDDTTSEGNQGYITRTETFEITGLQEAGMEKYTVVKGDTLQKISQKLYGTTKNWSKIYYVNKDKLKAPNKIYPGQVLDIPVEALKEPSENLK